MQKSTRLADNWNWCCKYDDILKNLDKLETENCSYKQNIQSFETKIENLGRNSLSTSIELKKYTEIRIREWTKIVWTCWKNWWYESRKLEMIFVSRPNRSQTFKKSVLSSVRKFNKDNSIYQQAQYLPS